MPNESYPHFTREEQYAKCVRPLNIIVACEYSGEVRDAMIARGHNAVSCDLLPTESIGPHFQIDALELIAHPELADVDQWDMLVAFPPCTDICVSGARYFKQKREDGRQQKAIDFFMAMANADIPMICIENPVGIMSSVYRKPSQYIQPYLFGHDASKRTCLWLKGLPPLEPTDIIKKERYANQTASGQNNLAPSPDRAKIRAKTYSGIAAAMADQWTPFVPH